LGTEAPSPTKMSGEGLFCCHIFEPWRFAGAEEGQKNASNIEEMKGKKMRKAAITLTVSAAMILSLTGVSGKAQAAVLVDFLQEKGVEVDISATIDVYDKYVWRGFRLDGDTVMQPGITISAAGFEAGFWGSWDLESHDVLSSDEVDGWIGYAFDLGFIVEDFEMIGISIGNTWYDFPEGSTYSKEMYLGISLDTLLSPYFTWYHDYGDEENGGADGNYYHFGIGHSLTRVEEYGISLDAGYELGLNDEAFIEGDGGYSLFTLGLTVPLSETLTMAPSIGYSVPFGDLEDSADGNQKEEFYGGVSLAYSF